MQELLKDDHKISGTLAKIVGITESGDASAHLFITTYAPIGE